MEIIDKRIIQDLTYFRACYNEIFNRNRSNKELWLVNASHYLGKAFDENFCTDEGVQQVYQNLQTEYKYLKELYAELKDSANAHSKQQADAAKWIGAKYKMLIANYLETMKTHGFYIVTTKKEELKKD